VEGGRGNVWARPLSRDEWRVFYWFYRGLAFLVDMVGDKWN
jgi:hypothetical protein